jgi:serine/threonine-protein kinase RIO1
MVDDAIRAERAGGWLVYYRADCSLDRIFAAAASPGEVLKQSSKTRTRRVGEWVVKESRFNCGRGLLKHTFRRERYRRAWRAALFLHAHGISVPAPVALIERSAGPVVLGNVFITEYLDGHHNVEDYARGLLGARQGDVDVFLAGIAEAVNALCASGAYHADLSGKNIYTKDGSRFWFIDLDEVVLNRPYTDKQRLENHAQLYDSFCDIWDSDVLEPFIVRMLPACYDAQAWLSRVRRAQKQRRDRQIAIWRRQGKPSF